MATSTNYTSIAYAAETVEGDLPTTPAFQLLPTTGGSPVANITTAMSEVIRADRQTDDLTVVDADISGDLNYELSYLPYKPLIISLLQNTVTSSISIAGADFDGIDFSTVSSTGIEALVNIGDSFSLSSTLDSDVDGIYTCIDNTTPNEITISPDMPSTVTGGQADTAIEATTIITNGATTPDSYTFRKIAINDGSSFYWFYKGCRINTMNFNFATGSILNGSLGIIGRTELAQDTPLGDELADIEVPTYSIMNSVNSIGKIYIEGIDLGTCSFSSLDLTVDNQTEAAKSIGTLGACATASFSLSITGNVEVFFKDLTMYQKFLAAESFGITILLDDDASDLVGNGMGINIPKCKFETLDTPIDGKDSFLKQSGSFRGLRDSVSDSMIKFSFIDKA